MANALDASRLASVFAEADADGSGTINADEIVAYFKDKLNMSADAVHHFMQSVDQDGDGEIDIHELLHAALAAKSTFRERARKALVYEAFVGSVIPPRSASFGTCSSQCWSTGTFPLVGSGCRSTSGAGRAAALLWRRAFARSG